MIENKIPQALYRLIQELASASARNFQIGEIFSLAVKDIAKNLSLNRAFVMLVSEENQSLFVAQEFAGPGISPLGDLTYPFSSASEIYKLLAEDKPVPLSAISVTGMDMSLFDQTKSVIAFPICVAGKLIGCLCLEGDPSRTNFSDDMLEGGESIAQILALACAKCRLEEEILEDKKAFAGSKLAIMILDKQTQKVVQANSNLANLLGYKSADAPNFALANILSAQDLVNLKQALLDLGDRGGALVLEELELAGNGGRKITVSCILSRASDPRQAMAIFATCDAEQSKQASKRIQDGAGQQGQTAKYEQLIASISRQLSYEKTARQIVCKLHASRDKDLVLQAAVDCLGQVLAASHCLIVKTEGPASPLVTHEYAEGDSSPLGLGRTSQFPHSAIACFRHKTCAIGELTGQLRPSELSNEDLEHLTENGIQSMLGTPITHDIGYQGLIIVLFAKKPRKWSQLEVELLETVAEQCAIALRHAETYAQLKDQLFKMDVIGNLTQQLTNALELATRSSKPPDDEEKQKQPQAQLSQREMEVLKLIAQGLANREIAQRLFLTESTVELHASRIRKKLKLKSRTALVKYAYDYHLV